MRESQFETTLWQLNQPGCISNKFAEKYKQDTSLNSRKSDGQESQKSTSLMLRSRSTGRARIKIPLADQESLERQNKVSMLMAINDLSLSSNQLNLHNGTPVKNQLYFINYQAATEQRSPYRVCMAKGNSIKRIVCNPPVGKVGLLNQSINNHHSINQSDNNKKSNRFLNQLPKRPIKQHPFKRMSKSVCRVFKNNNTLTRN